MPAITSMAPGSGHGVPLNLFIPGHSTEVWYLALNRIWTIGREPLVSE
jgi:hypothetical protein